MTEDNKDTDKKINVVNFQDYKKKNPKSRSITASDAPDIEFTGEAEFGEAAVIMLDFNQDLLKEHLSTLDIEHLPVNLDYEAFDFYILGIKHFVEFEVEDMGEILPHLFEDINFDEEYENTVEELRDAHKLIDELNLENQLLKAQVEKLTEEAKKKE